MQNLLQRIKIASYFFTGILAHHFTKLLIRDCKCIEQLAQEVRDLQMEVVTSNVLEIKASMQELNNVNESLNKKPNDTNNNTNNTINDELIQVVSDKTDDTNNLVQLKQLMENYNPNDPDVHTKMGEGLSKILDNSKEIQNFIELYKSSNSPLGGIKNFIGSSNFNLESLYAYLDSLSLLQESALLNICIFITILLTLISIFAALFGNEIINYFDLENKYPSISGFLKLRAKFQKYYLIWNIFLLLLLILGAICINIFVFVIS